MTRARELSKFANSQAFSVDSDFQVGINSTVPAATLDVRGDSVITGILTATSHDATGLTGTPDITVNNIVGAAATFSGVVTYEDVTNVDSVGVITARSDVSIADKIIHTGDTNTAIRFPAADTFTVETGGSERLRITSAGLVGVGTNIPENGLHVSDGSSFAAPQNSGAGRIMIEHASSSDLQFMTANSGYNHIFFGDQDDANIGSIVYHHNSNTNALVFSTNAAERVRINSSGNCGIGTDNPARLLHLHENSSDGTLLAFTNATTGSGGGDGVVIGIQDDESLIISNKENNHIELHTSNTERLRIDSAGDMGLGVTPDNVGSMRTLHIKGPSGEGAAIRLQDNGDTPGSSDAQIYKNSAALYLRVDGTDPLIAYLNGAERARMDSSGRLLIGHDSAAENNNMLEVSADHGGRIGFLRSDTSVSAGNNIGMLSFYGNDSNGTYQESARIQADADLDHATGDKPGRLSFLTSPDGSNTVAERLRIDSRGSFQFSNGFMNETVKINTTARTGTQAVNLDDGMVHYFSTNSSGTWKPNFTMSAGNDINATIATGDVFSPTMIVAKGATTHFANAIQVDGSDVTPEFLGGAPTDGGASGTFDVYNYTIIKTGDDTFKAFASVSTYE